jgi:hypothetical protein
MVIASKRSISELGQCLPCWQLLQFECSSRNLIVRSCIEINNTLTVYSNKVTDLLESTNSQHLAVTFMIGNTFRMPSNIRTS